LARLLHAMVVYDVGGWSASALDTPLGLDGLTVLVAPNGAGKTTVLSSLHPVFSVLSAAHVDYLSVGLRGYSSLRLMPPAVGYSEVAAGNTRYIAAWVRVSVGHERRSPIGLGDRVDRITRVAEVTVGEAARSTVERLIEAAASIELDARSEATQRVSPRRVPYQA